MTTIEDTVLLLSEKEAEYAMTLEPDDFWAWWNDRQVPSDG